MAHATPHINDGVLTYRDAMQDHTVAVGSPLWWHWLAAEGTTTFRFEHPLGHFTARRERKRDGSYWYAYRTRDRALHKAYLGKSADLTLDRLQEVAAVLVQRSAAPTPAAHVTSITSTEAAGPLPGALAGVPRDPLVTTKLALPPSRPALVPRPRLMDRLDAGLQRKLTLIAAPAGYGKTTLMADWLAARTEGRGLRTESAASSLSPQSSVLNPRAAWVSLDVGDNDVARFWSYAIAALQTLHADLGADALALLQSPQPPPLTTVLTLLINALAALPAPVALVLDDYHAITTPAIHLSLAFLLEHQPSSLRLVIISRSDPPLPLMRLRAHGELTEVRAADLGFSTDEIETFFNQLLGLCLATEEVAALAARTEGWIAGLVLVAHALHGHPNAAAFIRELSGSDRFILDYLVEDVLQQQPSHIQRFLLDTAILDQLTASLCDALLLGDDAPPDAAYSQLVLFELERKNLFLVPLDRQRRWYRYHQLFAEMLRSRAQRLQPERLPLLHRRASSWYVQQGLIVEAVEHALAAGEMEQAASLVEQIAQATLLRGEVTTLLGWLSALPEAIVHARPLLSLAHAWALDFIGHVDAAEAQLEDVGQHMQQQATAADGSLLGSAAAALQAFVAGQRGDVPGMMALAQQALARDLADSGAPRSLSLLALGNAHFFTGDLAAAHQTLATVIATHQVTGDLFATMMAIYILADVELHQGQLHQAAELLQQGLQLGTRDDGQPLPIAGLAHMALGDVLRERNELDAAMHSLRTGIALARQWGVHIFLVDSTIALARLKQACGDGDGALQVLRDFEAQTHDAWDTPWHRAQLAACRARLWLAQGQRALASQWAQDYAARLEAEEPKLRPLVKYGFAHTTLARVRLAEGRPEEAVQLLTRLLTVAEAGGWVGDVIEFLALQALAQQMQGASTQALTTLGRALALAEPEGHVRLFVDEGAPMAALLAQSAERRARSDPLFNYIEQLLRAFPEPQHQAQIVGRSPPERSNALVEPLSERELDVLRLLAAGLESPEIARELIISVSTARTHIKNIYGKLGVHGRVQAIERARALGLVCP
jgi:LuxR family transcriptional regulator, maltose regulon positive regulatory protein